MTQTDDVLVARAREGVLEAFDDLMLRYQRLVCRVALNYVRDRQSALDVTQNVFLKAFRNLQAVTAPGMFKPWLLRITYNESINWVRRYRRHEGREESAEHDRTVDTAASQEDRVVRGEAQRLVVAGLAELNPKYKLAVALRYAEGLRIREIASVMDCSEGMVKSLLFRGVRQIRRRVAKSA